MNFVWLALKMFLLPNNDPSLRISLREFKRQCATKFCEVLRLYECHGNIAAQSEQMATLVENLILEAIDSYNNEPWEHRFTKYTKLSIRGWVDLAVTCDNKRETATKNLIETRKEEVLA